MQGGGRKASFPGLDQKMLEWAKKQRQMKLIVNYPRFRRQGRMFADELGITRDQFACSTRWIGSFCKRNNIVNRRITHKTQAGYLDDIGKLQQPVIDFLQKVKEEHYPEEDIYNMDETPCYFDMCFNSTLHFKGGKVLKRWQLVVTRNVFLLCYVPRCQGNLFKQ